MHFTVEAQAIAKSYLAEGSIAIDATAGNGFDTLFLAEYVGSSGRVYALDLQTTAVEVTKQKLQRANLQNRVLLLNGSHESLDTFVSPQDVGHVSVVMFNLGYLPFGDKSIVTRAESTLIALQHSARMLRLGGLLIVLAYPGHSGGENEADQIARWVNQQAEFTVQCFRDLANKNSPILWSMTKYRSKPSDVLLSKTSNEPN
jgi:ubiquinone/menaquinone biosynthesis C-methylase UbiE